ncbi:MAG: hypothetical protein JWM16_1564 [Verrucomicrobiales bacterium]|nr:hypothetical protein [Verrucomicrobiales bacterium]
MTWMETIRANIIRRRSVLYLFTAILLVASGIWFFGTRGDKLVYEIQDTDIVSVSFRVTHGVDHVFIYPGPIRWGFDQLREKLGTLRTKTSQRMVTHTYVDSDVLWVTWKQKGPVADPNCLRAILIGPDGTRRILNKSGAFDPDRMVSVSRWPLTQGITSLTNSTLQIIEVRSEDRFLPNAAGRALVNIRLR